MVQPNHDYVYTFEGMTSISLTDILHNDKPNPDDAGDMFEGTKSISLIETSIQKSQNVPY